MPTKETSHNIDFHYKCRRNQQRRTLQYIVMLFVIKVMSTKETPHNGGFNSS